MKEDRKDRTWLWAFGVVCVLVLAQVVWWAQVFLSEVSRVETLAKAAAVSADAIQVIESEAYHRRLMFVCESATFAALTLLGFGILFRAFRKERRSRQIQRNFIEIFSHESKTPLTALKLQLEELRKKNPGDESLRVAMDQVRRLAAILEKALNLNRVERHDLDFETISLSELAEEVVGRLSSWAISRKVQVSLSLEDEGWVSGDRHGLQNALQSLLENAVLYTQGQDAKVLIRIHKNGNQVSLQVEDNGRGIPQHEVPRVFERFYRGTSSGSVPGTGLGLYLAKYLVEAHRGVIRYLAPKTGVGSCFEILLPSTGEPA